MENTVSRSGSHDETPRLPPEIEHEIFVLAFQNTENMADKPVFFRVAKRVSEWLIPIFYNALIMYNGTPNRNLPPLATLRIHGHHIRQLLAVNSSSLPIPIDLSELLSCCPNITNIAFWYGTRPPPELLTLSVRRLAVVDLRFLTDRLKADPTSLALNQWCSNITHLALGIVVERDDLMDISHFPALEYLMVFIFTHDAETGLLNEIVKHIPQLTGLIRLLGRSSSDDETMVSYDSQNEDDDIRIVHLDGRFVDDWTRGVNGLGDMWDIAKREIEKRRRGREDGSHSTLS